jgi:pilus assembly protein Flp/PilA
MLAHLNKILAMGLEYSGIVDIVMEAAMNLRSFISRFLRDQTGATAIEYGLIIGGLSIGIITAASSLGMGSGSVWTKAHSALDAAIPTGS